MITLPDMDMTTQHPGIGIEAIGAPATGSSGAKERPLKISSVMTLKTLADVRELCGITAADNSDGRICYG